MPNNCWINSDFSVSKHQVCADTMSQVSLFVDHIPFFCNSVFADGGLVTSCVTLLLKTFVNWFLHWRKPVFICRNAVGSGCSNSSETLSHYQKRPGSLQRAGEQAWAAQKGCSCWMRTSFVLLYVLGRVVGLLEIELYQIITSTWEMQLL